MPRKRPKLSSRESGADFSGSRRTRSNVAARWLTRLRAVYRRGTPIRPSPWRRDATWDHPREGYILKGVYEDAINETAIPYAPWFVVPADNKMTMRLIVATGGLEALEGMDMDYPQLSPERLEELKQYRKQLVDD